MATDVVVTNRTVRTAAGTVLFFDPDGSQLDSAVGHSGPGNTFQAVLFSDGRIEFACQEINLDFTAFEPSAVIGISPGFGIGGFRAVDWSAELPDEFPWMSIYQHFNENPAPEPMTGVSATAPAGLPDRIKTWPDSPTHPKPKIEKGNRRKPY